ncbi:MAG: toll/interleukin-1 receptor domain-containing protein [Bacteroidota bacterium]
MNYWIKHCEPPRSRSEGMRWDVFISYRSLDRIWAIALYDMLKQCGYQVFLDQFVLVTGQGLASQLGKNLDRSASGVLLWSKSTDDSNWVENEMDTMIARKNSTAGTEVPFFFVVASLDGKPPPGLLAGQLYLDFSEYSEGPGGADLVRLTSGLQGVPIGEDAVIRIVSYDQAVNEEPAKLRAMATAKRFEKIFERVTSDELAYTTSATLPGLAVEILIRGAVQPEEHERAIEAAKLALERFPNSLRLKQLQGLALRRSGRLDDALYELTLLHEEGHRDTETLGILAAVWADKWAQLKKSGDTSGARDALERSRNLYREGFAKVPTDTYTGINAASKSALLGEIDVAIVLADQVLAELKAARDKRGGEPSPDYWQRVTEPEALLIKGEWERSLELYHDARIAHQHEKGSIQSTAIQVKRLLGTLEVPDDIKKKLVAEFDLVS